jgi:hypothetical protein
MILPKQKAVLVEAEEILDASDVVEVLWDKTWSSNHPSNRIPTLPAVDEMKTMPPDVDDEVDTIEIPPEVVIPLLQKTAGAG